MDEKKGQVAHAGMLSNVQIALDSGKFRNSPRTGSHRVDVRNAMGDVSEALLEIRYSRIRVLPPIGKQKRYPELTLTVIYAQEQGTPQGRDRIDWKLITDLPVDSNAQAIEKLHWYASRWKIETF